MTSTNAIEDIYELSPAQNGMLFHDRFAPGSGVYVVQFGCTLEGDLDAVSFEMAWQRVVDRHAILRTAFHWQDIEKPLQVVGREARIPFERHDLRSLGSDQQVSRLNQALQNDREKEFDLGAAPLMRCALYRTADHSHDFVWTFHHLLLDGWSTSTVLQEVLTSYEHFRRGSNPRLEAAGNFGAYIEWMQKQDPGAAATFWSGLLKGCSVPTPLPAGFPRSQAHSMVNFELSETLPAEVTSSLQSLARRHQLTINTFVQGAWALLLNRHTGEEDIVFGATVSGRPPELNGVEKIVGMFINTLPVRVRVDSGQPLIPWLKELRGQQIEMQQFEFSPLVEIQKWSGLAHNRSIFDSIVVFENYPIESSLKDSGLSLEIKNVRSSEKTNFPLTLAVIPGPRLQLNLEYDPTRFDGDTVKRILRQLASALRDMSTNPDQLVGEVAVLPEEENRRLVRDWNQTQTNHGAGYCFTDLFEAQVRRTPEAAALRFGSDSLTYAELDGRANRLANYLIANGACRGKWIGICIPRSFDMVVALLGVLKAGAAYVPLDPSYPRERVRYMLEDSKVGMVLTHSSLADHAPATVQRIALDVEWDTIRTMPKSRPERTIDPRDLAYMIYTSGSTGRPKGVMIPHSGLVNYLTWAANEYSLKEGCGIPVQSPFGFDMTILSLHGPLIAGGCAYLLPEENSVEAMSELLEDTGGFSLLNLTPAHLEMLSHTLSPEAAARSAGSFVVGGEAMWAETLEFWRKNAPHARLVNEYGPTETVVGCCFYEVPPGPIESRAIPIGRPIANTTLYVLDRYFRVAPVGAVGELCIGGAGVGYGYLNRPDLTADKFIPDPFSQEPGARLYRSGDLSRRRDDGVIECLGRLDHQVKVRGFRIELGEIESALLEHPSIREALVVTGKDLPGEKQLIAYVVPHAGSELAVGDLREFLRTRIPAYMAPSIFVPLDSFPLTPNGKLDRAALPSPDGRRLETENPFVAPRTPLEEVLSAMWCEVLGLDQVGVHDNFFQLGGHSLLATQAVSRLSDVLQIAFPLRRLFEVPTIAALASAILADPIMRHTAEPAVSLLLEVSALPEEDVTQMLASREADAGAEVAP